MAKKGQRSARVSVGHVVSQTGLGGVSYAADVAGRFAAVPGQVLAAPVSVGQESAAASHRTQRGAGISAPAAAASSKTCRPRQAQSEGKMLFHGNHDKKRLIIADPSRRRGDVGKVYLLCYTVI